MISCKLQRQQFLVPARRLGNAVLGQCQGLDLGGRQMIDKDTGDGGHPELLGRGEPAMARDDDAILVDDDRAHEAEAADRGGDLADLLFRMRAGIAGGGLQVGDGDVLQVTGVPEANSHPNGACFYAA